MLHQRAGSPRRLTSALFLIPALALSALSTGDVGAAGPAPPAPPLAYAWGFNTPGTLGINSAVSISSTPLKVAGLTTHTVVSMAGGNFHSLWALDDGTVVAAGANGDGQLGIGVTDSSAHRLPVTVAGLAGVRAVSAGAAHSLALTDDGSVMAWGLGTSGQLGDGEVTTSYRSSVPGQVFGLADVTSIAAGDSHSLALLSDGHVWGWGNNTSGQLGDGSGGVAGAIANVPVEVQVLSTGLPLSGIVAIAAGKLHSLALDNTGHVWAWGSNLSRQADPLTPGGLRTRAVPVSPAPAVVPVENIVAIAGGGGHSLALKSNGTVIAWGAGGEGQLGNNAVTPPPSAPPLVVPGLSGVVAIAAGGFHSLAALADGSSKAWGRNVNGQLGTGDSIQRNGPAPVRGIEFVGSLAAGAEHSLANTFTPDILAQFTAPGSIACSASSSVDLSLNGYDLTDTGLIDIELVLDESGSMDATEFSQVKSFALNLVNSLTFGPDNVALGIVMFGSSSRVLIPPNTNRQSVLNAINGLAQQGGATCIGCGVQTADQQLVTFGRPGVPRTMIVMTDGVNNVNTGTFMRVLLAAKSRATLVSIGVGSDVDPNQINLIASAPKLAFLTPNFNALVNVVDDLYGVLKSPGVSNAQVTLNFSAALDVDSAAGATISGNTVTWNLATLGAAARLLHVTFHHSGAGGTLPVLISGSYTDEQGHTQTLDAGAIEVHGCAATIMLSPDTATNFVDELHTVTATVHDSFNNPVAGTGVSFTVISGPNAGAGTTTPIVTDASGHAVFTYANTGGPGTDQITAAAGASLTAGPVEKIWRPRNEAPVANATGPGTVALNGSHFASFTLNGSGSSDPDGIPQPLSYAWAEIGGGVVGRGVTPTISNVPIGDHTYRLTVSDGDLSDFADVTVHVVDPTAPVVTPSIVGTLGNNGWFTSDVQVSFTVIDLESNVTTTGCNLVNVSVDTPGQTLTCTATSAGGSTSGNASFKRDATDPSVTPPANQSAEQTEAGGAHVSYPAPGIVENGSGLASSSCSPASGSLFPRGTTAVICRATDNAGNMGSDSFNVEVHDSIAPVVTPPANMTVEQAGGGGTMVSYPAPSIVETGSGIATSSCTPASGSLFPTGTTTVNCEATDNAGNIGRGSFRVTVGDTTPPVIASVTPSQDSLWPPNHKMVPISFAIAASDGVSAVSCQVVSVSSNQPINGTGDGDTGPDWQILSATTVNFRAERAGNSNADRIYTATIRCLDTSGNSAIRQSMITVPHNR